MADETYMTVGEVADLVGVTVRSIQYYDQQGILSPSAKGPQNQRLYTRDDVRRLYEVVCLKYAGLSLSQIKDLLAGPSDGGAVTKLFSDAMHETEEAFSTLLRRYATLRGLAQTAELAAAAHEEPDWQALAHTIESKRDEGRFFWRLSCIYDEEVATDEASDAPATPAERDLIAEWHGVMAEAVGLMRSREPLDSPRSRAVAEKVLALREEDARLSHGAGFMLLENVPASHLAGAAASGHSFDDLRQEMNAFLERLVEANRATAEPGRATAGPSGRAAGSHAGMPASWGVDTSAGATPAKGGERA